MNHSLKKLKVLTFFCLVLLIVGVPSISNESIICQSQIDKKVNEVILCESGGRHEGVWGDLDKSYPAYGIAQFQRRTFKYFKRLAKRPKLRWKNKDDQKWLLKWALENNLGYHWACYKEEIK